MYIFKNGNIQGGGRKFLGHFNPFTAMMSLENDH